MNILVVLLRPTPGTFIGTPIVRKQTPFKKEEWEWVAQSEFEKADEFNGQFTDVFTKTGNNQVPLLDRSAPIIEEIVVTKEGVTKLP